MTQQGFSPPRGVDDDPSTAQVAKDQAASVGQKAAERGGQVAGTAADQAKEVAAEARRQASDLMDQGMGELREQARTGQTKAAAALNTIADQLQGMSDKTDEPGVAPDVVHEVAQRTKKVASWLDSREPGDLVDEVRAFARRRPGAFLAGAAVAGLLVGRLTRGAVAAQKEESRPTGQNNGRTDAAAPAPSWQETDQFAAQPEPPAVPQLPGTQYAQPPEAYPTPGYAAPGYSMPGVQEPGTGRQPGMGV